MVSGHSCVVAWRGHSLTGIVDVASLANVSQMVGDSFGHSIGSPLLSGIAILAFFLFVMFYLKVPADLTLVFLIPLLFVITVSGILPTTMFMLVVIGAGLLGLLVARFVLFR